MTLTTRAEALAARRSISKWVSNNGATTLTAKFDPIPSQLARRGGPPGVVDQHIQARRQGLELCHQGIHIRQPGKISQQQRNRPAAADLPDLSYSSFTAGLAAPGDIDLRPHPSQRQRGLFANTAGAAGDQHSCLACFTFAEEYLSPVL